VTAIFVYILIFIIINNTLTFPDINDFLGLSQICVLMQDNLKYCVNNGWGFAHPLINYLLTQITGNLLISQRIISGFFTLCALVISKKIMEHVLPIENKLARLYILLFFATTPWYIASIVSVHLDIAAITFILLGILLLNIRKPVFFFWSGMLISISYWFRFHFLIYVMLYPAVVYLFHLDNQGRRKFIFCVLGVMVGILIPHILCFSIYGVTNIWNQKLVLGRWAGIFDISLESVRRLEAMSYSDIIKRIPLTSSFIRFGSTLADLRVILLLIFYFVFIVEYFLKVKENIKYKVQKKWSSTKYFRLLILILYMLLSVLPFVYVRGSTLRLWSALFIVSLPICAYIAFTSKRVHYYIIVFLFVISSLWVSRNQFIYFYFKNKYFEELSHTIEKVIPSEELSSNYNKILMVTEFYNKYNKYLGFSPVVMGGWPAHFKPLNEKLGQVDIFHLFQAKTYEKFNYIVLPNEERFLQDFLPADPLNEQVFSNYYILLETEKLVIIKIEHL